MLREEKREQRQRLGKGGLGVGATELKLTRRSPGQVGRKRDT